LLTWQASFLGDILVCYLANLHYIERGNRLEYLNMLLQSKDRTKKSCHQVETPHKLNEKNQLIILETHPTPSHSKNDRETISASSPLEPTSNKTLTPYPNSHPPSTAKTNNAHFTTTSAWHIAYAGLPF